VDWLQFKTSHVYDPDGSLFSTTRDYQNVFWGVGNSYNHSIVFDRDGLGRAAGVSLDSGASGTGGTLTLASAGQYHPSGLMSGMSYGNGLDFSQTLTARLQPPPHP